MLQISLASAANFSAAPVVISGSLTNRGASLTHSHSEALARDVTSAHTYTCAPCCTLVKSLTRGQGTIEIVLNFRPDAGVYPIVTANGTLDVGQIRIVQVSRFTCAYLRNNCLMFA